MKNKKILGLFLWSLIVAFSVNVAQAAMMNPAPALFFDDDDTTFFTPNNLVIGFEIYDIGDFFPTAFSEFGFFFAGKDPTIAANRTTIFGNEDFFDLVLGEAASINFNTGIVRDLSDLSVQDIFAPGIGNIGFFYTVNSLTIYTATAYNTFGDVGTFQSRSNPNAYLLGFDCPLLDVSLGFEIVAGITPVPEPATILLLMTGIAGLAPALRGRKRG